MLTLIQTYMGLEHDLGVASTMHHQHHKEYIAWFGKKMLS